MILDKTVAILLSTYNGSKYISEQIQSIRNQKFTDWVLYVRDDMSNDDTLQLVEKLAEEDGRIKTIKSTENLGVNKSFLHLLTVVDADYYFFCDQDDKWHFDKLFLMLNEMINEEKGKDALPILGLSDATVVDDELHVLHSSFWDFNMLLPELFFKKSYVDYINIGPGCTMVLNKALKDVYTKNFLDFDFMYDWYLVILASKFGSFFYMPEKLVQYRQHQNNVVGAEKVSLFRLLASRIKNLKQIHVKHQKHYEFLKKNKNLSLFNFYFNKMKFNFIRFQYARSRKS